MKSKILETDPAHRQILDPAKYVEIRLERKIYPVLHFISLELSEILCGLIVHEDHQFLSVLAYRDLP